MKWFAAHLKSIEAKWMEKLAARKSEKKLKILIHLGLFTEPFFQNWMKDRKKGAPLGEMVQYSVKLFRPNTKIA